MTRLVEHERRHERLERASPPRRHEAHARPFVPTAEEGMSANVLWPASDWLARLPPAGRWKRAHHAEPVRFGHVTLADRDEAPEARLGVEDAVVEQRGR